MKAGPAVLARVGAALLGACALAGTPVVEAAGAREKIAARYFETLDAWVAEQRALMIGDPRPMPERFMRTVQDDVVPTCGKLVMATASTTEAAAFLSSGRDEFDFRVDVCTKATVHRVLPQPEFKKEEIVEAVCRGKGQLRAGSSATRISLFSELCRRGGMGAR